MGAKGKKSPSEPGGETRGLHSVTVGRSVTVHRHRSILLGSWCCSNDNTRQVGIHVSVVIENEEKKHTRLLPLCKLCSCYFFLHFFLYFCLYVYHGWQQRFEAPVTSGGKQKVRSLRSCITLALKIETRASSLWSLNDVWMEEWRMSIIIAYRGTAMWKLKFYFYLTSVLQH